MCKDYLLITDTHLGIKNNNEFWLDVVSDFFDSVIEYAINNNITNIIHLGDFFNDRKSLNVLTLNKGQSICEKFKKFNLDIYIIKGNHDQYYANKTETTSLHYLSLIDNVHIVNSITEIEKDTYLIPWGLDFTHLPEDSILMGHFEINGFNINPSGNEMKNAKINISDFKKFKQVYSGHFHAISQQKNITYIGSSIPLNFNDKNSLRGFYTYKNNHINFIPYNDSPSFIEVFSTDNFKEKSIKNNIIKFIFTEDYGTAKNQKLLQEIYDMNPLEVHIKFFINDEVSLDTLTELEYIDNNELLDMYIKEKEFPAFINKSVLLKIKDNLLNKE